MILRGYKPRLQIKGGPWCPPSYGALEKPVGSFI